MAKKFTNIEAEIVKALKGKVPISSISAKEWKENRPFIVNHIKIAGKIIEEKDDFLITATDDEYEEEFEVGKISKEIPDYEGLIADIIVSKPWTYSHKETRETVKNLSNRFDVIKRLLLTDEAVSVLLTLDRKEIGDVKYKQFFDFALLYVDSFHLPIYALPATAPFYPEYAIKSVRKNPYALKYVNSKHCDYDKVIAAICETKKTEEFKVIDYIDKKHPHFEQLMEKVVRSDPSQFDAYNITIDEPYYDKLAIIAVSHDKSLIAKVDERTKSFKDLFEYAKDCIEMDYNFAYRHRDQLDNFKEICLYNAKRDPMFMLEPDFSYGAETLFDENGEVTAHRLNRSVPFFKECFLENLKAFPSTLFFFTPDDIKEKYAKDIMEVAKTNKKLQEYIEKNSPALETENVKVDKPSVKETKQEESQQ